MGKGNSAPGCCGLEPCALGSHGRIACCAAQFSSVGTVGRQQSTDRVVYGVVDEAKSLGVRVKRLGASDALTLGESDVRVLAPMLDYQPGPEPANNDSLVLRVSYGAT